MMYTTSHKRRRCLGVAAAVLFCFSVFSFSAFATGETPPPGTAITTDQTGEDTGNTGNTGDTGSDTGSNPGGNTGSSSENQNSGGNSGTDTGSGTGSNTGSENTASENDGTDNGNGTDGGNTTEPDRSESSSHSRGNGGNASSSKQPVVVSPPQGVASAAPDSRAATDFTSEDLQGLLSDAGSSLPSTDGFLREDTNNGDSSGGLSSLLLGGIALILLGIAGVVLFVYRQFVRSKRRPVSAATGPLPAITGYRPAPKTNGAMPHSTAAPAEKKPTPEISAQSESTAESHKSPALPRQDAEPELPSGEFTDITSGRSAGPDRDGFDWDQFFKNIPPDDSQKS